VRCRSRVGAAFWRALPGADSATAQEHWRHERSHRRARREQARQVLTQAGAALEPADGCVPAAKGGGCSECSAARSPQESHTRSTASVAPPRPQPAACQARR
jgi:hypothetical protein